MLENAQLLIGYLVLAIVMTLSLVSSIDGTLNKTKADKVLLLPLRFVATFLFCYIVLGVVGGLVWCLAWLGIILRDVVQWFIEAILLPLRWLPWL